MNTHTTTMIVRYCLILLERYGSRRFNTPPHDYFTCTNMADDTTQGFHALYQFAKNNMRRVDYRGFIVIAVRDHLIRQFLKSYRESDMIVELLYDHPVLCARDKDKFIPRLDNSTGLNYHNNNWVIEYRNSTLEEWRDYVIPVADRPGVFRQPKFISSVDAQKTADYSLRVIPHKRITRHINYSV